MNKRGEQTDREKERNSICLLVSQWGRLRALVSLTGFEKNVHVFGKDVYVCTAFVPAHSKTFIFGVLASIRLIFFTL